MSKQTREEELLRLRRRYATAGRMHKIKLIDQAVELLGHHRKAAIQACPAVMLSSFPAEARRAKPSGVLLPGLIGLDRPRAVRFV